jgi:hypothetical protein
MGWLLRLVETGIASQRLIPANRCCRLTPQFCTSSIHETRNHLYQIEASGLTIDAGFNQPQQPSHPQTSSRQYARPIVTLPSSSP